MFGLLTVIWVARVVILIILVVGSFEIQTKNSILKPRPRWQVNSHVHIVSLGDVLVLNAKLSILIGRGNWWNWNVGCEILSAFCRYQNFDDLNFLSGFNLSKTRGRSAIFRENYNLNTVIAYGMTWNFLSLVNQTFWKRWWPQVMISSALSV